MKVLPPGNSIYERCRTAEVNADNSIQCCLAGWLVSVLCYQPAGRERGRGEAAPFFCTHVSGTRIHNIGQHIARLKPVYVFFFLSACWPISYLLFQIRIAGQRHQGRRRRHRFSGIQHTGTVAYRYRSIPVPDWGTLFLVPTGLGYPFSGTGQSAFRHSTKLHKGTSFEGSSVRR